MAGKIQLQQGFQKTYELPLFIKDILYPVFANRVKIFQAPIIETNKANSTELRIIKSVKCYGQIDLDDDNTIKCYEIVLNPGVRLEYNKVSVQQYVRKLLTAGQAILVNFQQPEDKNLWRLSLVASDSKIVEDKIEQVKTNAKRYTFLLGPSETCRTASERFEELEALKDINIENLIKAFSVEKLSKSFFDEYKKHYQSFNSYLINSNFRSSVFSVEKQKDENAEEYKPIRDFVKKMLGRIVFLYFVQKKGWLAASTTKYTDGDYNFIMNLFMKSGANETFYPNHLCKLFFEALNTPRSADRYSLSFGKGKTEEVCVPFLNGGLFEKEKFDNKTLPFPASLFHNKANDEDPKHRGFLDFLNAFNFTIYEDSPDDHTVAVDPEMLGHIFENLLEDNKDKGAYYTPKEIVHYMCQESLIEYLNTKLNVFEVPLGYTDKGLKTDKPKSKPTQLALTQVDVRDNIKRQEIEDFVKNKNANEFIFKNAKSIDVFLDTVKVCDPAIGSGAFPMGLMQEIFALKMVLHDFVFTASNELFHLKDYDPRNYRSNVKLNIIQNSIYGVDIEHGAVDIARLRFWLSLIVDEQTPKALPNLDYKIVIGNSLVSKFDDEVIDIDWEVKAGTDATKKLQQQIHNNLEKLFTRQKQFFNYKGDKAKLQAEIRNLKIDVLKNQLELDKYKYSQKAVRSGNMFSPTVREKQQSESTGIQLASYDKAIKKLEKLKLQPNKPLNFFAWKLTFPEVMNKELNPNNGFDIIIGNPPYVSAVTMSRDEQTKKYFKEKYPLATGSYDLYLLFLLEAVRLSNNTGIYTWIIPNKFLIADYAKKSKTNLIESFGLSYSLNVSTFNVFEGVGVYPIIILGNKKNQHPFQELILENYFDLKARKFKQPITLNSHKTFQDYFIQINSGATGFQAEELKEIVSCKEKKGSIPFAVSGNIDRYNWSNQSVRYMGETYPVAFINNGTKIVADSKWSFWSRPKIVIAGMTKVIESVYVEGPLGLGVGVYGIYNFGGYDPYCLVAILNSRYLTYYFQIKFKDKHLAGGYLAINKSTILEFPLVEIPRKYQVKLAQLSKTVHGLVKNSQPSVRIENEIDILVYSLYNLKYDEIKLIDQNFALSEAEYVKIKI